MKISLAEEKLSCRVALRILWEIKEQNMLKGGWGEGKEMSSDMCHYIILIYIGLSECNAMQFILGGTAPPEGTILN